MENNTSENLDEILSEVIPGEKTTVTIDGHKYYVQIPEEGINSETSFFIAGRGGESILDTYETFDESIGKNEVVVAPYQMDSEYYLNALEVVDYYKNKNNNSTTNVIKGHGASCGTALQATIYHSEQTNEKPTLIFCDSKSYNPMNIKNIEAVDGIPVINFTNEISTDNQLYVENMAKNGANILTIEYSTNFSDKTYNHGFSDDLAAYCDIQSTGENGVYDLNNLQSVVRYNAPSAHIDANISVDYSFCTYDENGKQIKLSKSQAQEYLSISNEIAKLTEEKLNTTGSINSTDMIKTQIDLDNANAKLKNLLETAKNNTDESYQYDNEKINNNQLVDNKKNTDDLTESTENNESDAILDEESNTTTEEDNSQTLDDSNETQSDTATIDTFVSELNSKISSSVIRNKNLANDSYESTTSVPPIESPIISKLFNSAEELLNKVALEARYIEQVGSEFETMDVNLSTIADSLNYEITSTKANMVEVDPQYTEVKDNDYSLSTETIEQYETLIDEIEKEKSKNVDEIPEEEIITDEKENSPSNIEDNDIVEEPIQVDTEVTPDQNKEIESNKPIEEPVFYEPTEFLSEVEETNDIVQNEQIDSYEQPDIIEIPEQTNQNDQSYTTEYENINNIENVDNIDFNGIVTDEYKNVYDIANNAKAIFNHENGKVTGMSHVYTFESENELNEFLNDIGSHYSETHLINKIITDNKNVIIEFKEDAFKNYVIDSENNLGVNALSEEK